MKHLVRNCAAVLLLVVICGAWLFCSLEPSSSEIRNVLLVSIDTCRADHLSCYGYEKKTTPNIDKLAKKGVRFENVISPVPLTLPSHSSMFTGTIPPYHGVHDNLDYKLDPANITLAETLKDNGFTTGAIVSSFVLDSRTGIDKGFDSYDDNVEQKAKTRSLRNERKGDKTTDLACDWLADRKNDKFFLFLHYYDPHESYRPPEPFASKFKSSPYAGEIAFADHCIGRVIKKLKKLGLYNSTLIVVVGDHGEMLGEHDEQTHGYYIYQSAIKVPLVVKLPGKQKGKVVKEAVGLIDIAPTIYDLLNIESPQPMHGKSLSDLLAGETAAENERYIFSESLFPTNYNANSLLSVSTDRYKYIQTTFPELYDLTNDPEEKNNLADKESQRVRIMKDKLAQVLEESVRKDGLDSKLETDNQAVKRLESLGYVGGSISEDFDFDQTKEDPKNFFKYYTKYLESMELVGQKEYFEAKKLLREIIKDRPDVHFWYSLAAEIAMEQKNYSQVIDNLKKVLKVRPNDASACNDIAIAYRFQKKFHSSVKYFKKALDTNPYLEETHLNLGIVLEMQGKVEESIVHYKKTIELKPDFAEAHYNLAAALTTQDKVKEGEKHYRRAIELAPGMMMIYNDFAINLSKQGKFKEAVEILEEAIALPKTRGDDKLREQIASRLKLYKSGKKLKE